MKDKKRFQAHQRNKKNSTNLIYEDDAPDIFLAPWEFILNPDIANESTILIQRIPFNREMSTAYGYQQAENFSE